MRRPGLVVLISGRGSNLQAIIDAIARGELDADLRAVISNDPQAPGLERARAAGAPAEAVSHRGHASRAQFERALAARIDAHAPDLVVLAGFMRILGTDFVNRFAGALINIHPSLLPDFPGLDTHRRALQAGRREHGATVHFVTAELDGGPAIAQARVPVHDDDDEDTLAARVLAQEHRLLPWSIGLVTSGRVRLGQDGSVTMDGQPLRQPLQLGPPKTI